MAKTYKRLLTKAKEHLGRLFRKGRVRCDAPFHVFDHDFLSLAEGVLIPHGIYDVGPQSRACQSWPVA